MNKSITAFVLAAVLWLPQVTSASTLTPSQIDAILGLLRAFNVDQATITIVRDELKPESIQSFNFVPAVQSATTTTTESHQATPQGVLALPPAVPAPVAPTQTIALKNPSACSVDVKSDYDLSSLIVQTFPDPTWKPEEPRFGGIKMAVLINPKPSSVIIDITPSDLDPHNSDYPYHKDITGLYSTSKSCSAYLYTLAVNQKGTYTVTVTTPETSKATIIQVN